MCVCLFVLMRNRDVSMTRTGLHVCLVVCFTCADAKPQCVYDNDLFVCFVVFVCCVGVCLFGWLCSCVCVCVCLLVSLCVLFVLMRHHHVSMTTTCLVCLLVCLCVVVACVFV